MPSRVIEQLARTGHDLIFFTLTPSLYGADIRVAEVSRM